MVFMLAGTKPTGLTRLTESRFSSCFPFLAWLSASHLDSFALL
jgi:hypothetical protein